MLEPGISSFIVPPHPEIFLAKEENGGNRYVEMDVPCQYIYLSPNYDVV